MRTEPVLPSLLPLLLLGRLPIAAQGRPEATPVLFVLIDRRGGQGSKFLCNVPGESVDARVCVRAGMRETVRRVCACGHQLGPEF